MHAINSSRDIFFRSIELDLKEEIMCTNKKQDDFVLELFQVQHPIQPIIIIIEVFYVNDKTTAILLLFSLLFCNFRRLLIENLIVWLIIACGLTSLDRTSEEVKRKETANNCIEIENECEFIRNIQTKSF